MERRRAGTCSVRRAAPADLGSLVSKDEERVERALDICIRDCKSMIIHTTLGTLNPIQSCHQCVYTWLCWHKLARPVEKWRGVQSRAAQSRAEERRGEEPVGIDSNARATRPLALQPEPATHVQQRVRPFNAHGQGNVAMRTAAHLTPRSALSSSSERSLSSPHARGSNSGRTALGHIPWHACLHRQLSRSG